jgi:putative ABC transport system permease protein
VDHNTYFDLYPEYLFKPDELLAFKRDRLGAAVGRKLADTHGWKIGDVIPIRGTIYQGDWRFTLRAIFDGKDEGTITRQFYFHYDYLNETVKKSFPRRGDSVGIFLVDIKDASRAAEISRAVDDTFKNSLAETLTETEKAFQLSFVAQSEAIVLAIRVVSFVVIFIIMTVVANTMAMTARERTSEYATLKALGYTPLFVGFLVFSEAMLLSLFGAGIGILLTFPVAATFGAAVASVFPVFRVSQETLYLQLICACVVGVVAAVVPGFRSANIKIVDGLRHRG